MLSRINPAIFCFLLFCSTVFAQEAEVVKIGLIIPLTGGLATRGTDVTKFLPLLQDHLNRSGKTYRYEFLVEDGKCGSGNAATSAAMKFINIDKVKFLITGCSGETLQVGPIAEKNRIVQFAILSLHPKIKSLGEYIFRTFIDVEKSAAGMADYMTKNSGGKIAVLTEENAFTFSVRDELLKNLGDKVVFADDFALDSVDFNTLLTKANSKGAKGIYLNVMSEGTLANLVNQAKRMNLSQQLYSYNMPEAASFRAATGENSNGLEFIGTPNITESSTEFKLLMMEFLKKYPEGPNYEFVLRTFHAAIQSIVAGIEQVGSDTTKIKDFLYTYSSFGALGKIKYDRNGDIEGLHYVLKRVRDDGREEIVGKLVNE